MLAEPSTMSREIAYQIAHELKHSLSNDSFPNDSPLIYSLANLLNSQGFVTRDDVTKIRAMYSKVGDDLASSLVTELLLDAVRTVAHSMDIVPIQESKESTESST